MFFKIICKLWDNNIFKTDICAGRHCITLIAEHEVTSINFHSSPAYNMSRTWCVQCCRALCHTSETFISYFFLLWLSFWNRNVLWSDVWQNCRLYLTALYLHIIKRSNEIHLHELLMWAFLKFALRVSSFFYFF